MKESRLDEKEIVFGKKLILKSKIEKVYTEKVVPSGNSARINCKINFKDCLAFVVILPKGERLAYSTK